MTEEAPLVIYIDDEPGLCRVFELNMKAQGFRARSFTDPAAALSYINTSKQPIHAVLCDHRMPDMTGLEVIEQITVPVPIFLVTGDHNLAEIELSTEHFRGVITKPFTSKSLAERLWTLE